MIVAAADEFSSDFEFQLIAGMFHEDIDELASATKYLPTRDHFYPGSSHKMQVLLRVCEAES